MRTFLIALFLSFAAAAPAFALNPQPEPPGVSNGHGGQQITLGNRLQPGPC